MCMISFLAASLVCIAPPQKIILYAGDLLQIYISLLTMQTVAWIPTPVPSSSIWTPIKYIISAHIVDVLNCF